MVSGARTGMGLSSVEGVRWSNGRGTGSDAPDRTTGRCQAGPGAGMTWASAGEKEAGQPGPVGRNSAHGQ
jgi:hypothetical protein